MSKKTYVKPKGNKAKKISVGENDTANNKEIEERNVPENEQVQVQEVAVQQQEDIKEEHDTDEPAADTNDTPQPSGDCTMLPEGTIVECPGTEKWYKIVQHINSGSFGNTYLVITPDRNYKVLKEFFPAGSKRKDFKIEFTSSVENDIAKQKFLEEPKRIIDSFKVIVVSDEKTLDEAYEEAKKKGGLFKWKGNVCSAYGDKEKDKLNLAFPETDCCFEWKGNHYYVMDRAKGKTLSKFIADNKKIDDLDLILQIMEQLAIAVRYIHQEMNCVHMDLSPDNIMVHIDGNGLQQLKVIDFGLAANLDKINEDNKKKDNNNTEKLPGTFVIGGTDGYTDLTFPNRHKKYIDENRIKLIDIYSMGAILEKLLDSYSGTEKELLDKCKEIVNCAKNDELKERYQSAEDFLIAIRKHRCRISWDNDGDVTVVASQREVTATFCTNAIKDENGNAVSKWNATIECSNGGECSWISIDGEPTGYNNDLNLLKFTIQPNETDKERKAIVKVESGVMVISKTIIQEAASNNAIKEPDIYCGQESIDLNITQLSEKVVSPSEDKITVVAGEATEDYAVRPKTPTVPDAAGIKGQSKHEVEEKEGEKAVPTKLDKKVWTKWFSGIVALFVVGIITWLVTRPGTGIVAGKKILLEVPANVFIAHKGGEVPIELKTNNEWKAEIVEQTPKDWLGIKNEIGDEKQVQFLLNAEPNIRYEQMKATVKVTAGDVEKLMKVTQGIDRVDSLQTYMEEITLGRTQIMPLIKKLDHRFSLYEISEGSTVKEPVYESLDVILRNRKPDMVIGETHDVAEFEENAATGKVKSITLKKR